MLVDVVSIPRSRKWGMTPVDYVMTYLSLLDLGRVWIFDGHRTKLRISMKRYKTEINLRMWSFRLTP